MYPFEEELQRFQEDIEYFEARRDELLQEYPDMWVAVLDKRVVGADADAKRLLDTLAQRGIPLERVVIRHLTVNEDDLILLSR